VFSKPEQLALAGFLAGVFRSESQGLRPATCVSSRPGAITAACGCSPCAAPTSDASGAIWKLPDAPGPLWSASVVNEHAHRYAALRAKLGPYRVSALVEAYEAAVTTCELAGRLKIHRTTERTTQRVAVRTIGLGN
jgi:hypothetical protein